MICSNLVRVHLPCRLPNLARFVAGQHKRPRIAPEALVPVGMLYGPLYTSAALTGRLRAACACLWQVLNSRLVMIAS